MYRPSVIEDWSLNPLATTRSGQRTQNEGSEPVMSKTNHDATPTAFPGTLLRAARLTLTAFLLAATVTAVGHATEPHPIVARGFEADKVYDFNDLDHVNLFNGNLVVAIPIGQRYPVNRFDYEFTLVYNSQIWDYVIDNPNDGADPPEELDSANVTDPAAASPSFLRGIPNRRSNSGTGWQLTFGALHGPTSQNTPGNYGWMFVASDGSEHHFSPPEGVTDQTSFPKYTRDGSFLRLLAPAAGDVPACAGISGCRVVETPGGRVYAFEPAATASGWRLRRLQDLFGNGIEIDYSVAGQWTVTDSVGREHVIVLDTTGTLTQGTVKEIRLSSFPGTSATYKLNYQVSQAMAPGCPHDFGQGIIGVSSVEKVVQLTSVERPDTSKYIFSYVEDDGTEALGQVCSRYQGRLDSLSLPTGATVAYEYGAYHYPFAKSCDDPDPLDPHKGKFSTSQWGVSRRTTTDVTGVLLADVHYRGAAPLVEWSPQRFANASTGTCIVPRVSFTDVWELMDQGRYRLTRNFFTVSQPVGGSLGVTDPWEPDEVYRYGLPLDHLQEHTSFPNHYRSSMVFDCPAFSYESLSYPADWPDTAQHLRIPSSCYDADGDGEPTNDTFLTPADVHGLRDRYAEYEAGDDVYCDGDEITNPRTCDLTQWRPASTVTVFHDHPDAYYVKETKSGYDGYGHYRTTVTSSNAPQSPTRTDFVNYNPTLGQNPDLVTPWLLTTFTERSVSESGQTSRVEYSFDSATGFLEAKTTVRSGGNLTATFTPDPSGNGNVQKETYTGGDPGRASYVIENAYQGGTLSRSEYTRGGRTILRTVDADIDADTGLPAASRDPAGLETLYTFDALGRLTFEAQQGSLAEAETSYTYTKADPASTGDKRARVTITRGDTSSQIFFDGLGRVKEERNTLPGGTTNRRVTTFTPQGQPDSVSTLHDVDDAANAKQTRTDYDIFGRPARVWRPDDELASSGTSQTFFWYQGIFDTIRQTNDVETPQGPKPFRTNFHYDHQGRLVEVEELENNSPDDIDVLIRAKYTYDEGGRLVRVNQGGGTQIRTFDYDGAGLLTEECHPELANGCIRYGGFDSRGNPGQRRYSLTGGAPFELDYVYDGAERITQVRRASDGKLLKELFYTNLYGGAYAVSSGNGKLYQTKRHNYLGLDDVVTSVTHSYGGIGGRLSRRTVKTGGHGGVPRVRFSTDFSYDALGNLARITYPDCTRVVGCDNQDPYRQIVNTFTRGLLTGVGTAGDPSHYASFTYHPNLTVDQIVHGNGVRDDFDMDPSQMPRPGGIEVRTTATPGSGTLWEATYAYDGAGNLVSRTSQGFDGAGTVLFNGTDLFRYDHAFNRLLSATIQYPTAGGGASESRDYTYDVFGNLLSVTGSSPRSFAPNGATNRLQSPYTYDAAGNLSSQPGWIYDYDAFNLITRAQSSGGSVFREHLYTADDERLAVLSSGRERWSVRGPDARVLRDFEYLSTGWRWIEDYIHYGGGLLATESDIDGEKHYHLDHLGSPRLVTDTSQQVKARHVYAPYGEELTEPLQDEGRLRFTGHERDDLDQGGQVGDLDYMHARYYSPWLGRFSSVDAVLGSPSNPGGWNRYVYANDNPLRFTDPDGNSPISLFSKILQIAHNEVYTPEKPAKPKGLMGPILDNLVVPPLADAVRPGLGKGSLSTQLCSHPHLSCNPDEVAAALDRLKEERSEAALERFEEYLRGVASEESSDTENRPPFIRSLQTEDLNTARTVLLQRSRTATSESARMALEACANDPSCADDEYAPE